MTGMRNGWPTVAALLLADVSGIAVATLVGGALTRLMLGSASSPSVSLISLFIALQILGLGSSGLRQVWGGEPITTLARSAQVLGLSTLFMALAMLATSQSWQSIVAIVASGCLSAVAVPAARSLVRFLLGKSSWWGRPAFVLGSGPQALAIYTKLTRQPRRGLHPVGIIDDLESLDPQLDPALYLGSPENLRELTRKFGVNVAIVADSTGSIETQRLFCREETGIRDWVVMPSPSGLPSLWVQGLDLEGNSAFWARNRLHFPGLQLCKRTGDLAFTLLSVAAASPLILAIMLVIRLSSRGSVFYAQERVGRHGRRFHAWKFRTMVPNADQVLEKCLASDPMLRAEWEANHKLKRDPRVTMIGSFLRKTSLDELPQLWNVVRGEMSLVGPRPIVEAEIYKYADDYEYYVEVLPGITGLWQVSGRNNTTYEERVALDAFYVKNWSLWMDIYILISTVRVILFREGAY